MAPKGRSTPRHTCHAKGCNRVVPPEMFMCKEHWLMLPKMHRDAIWREYVPGQEKTKTPSIEYVEVAQRAIAWLERYEANQRALRTEEPSGR